MTYTSLELTTTFVYKILDIRTSLNKIIIRIYQFYFFFSFENKLYMYEKKISVSLTLLNGKNLICIACMYYSFLKIFIIDKNKLNLFVYVFTFLKTLIVTKSFLICILHFQIKNQYEILLNFVMYFVFLKGIRPLKSITAAIKVFSSKTIYSLLHSHMHE